MLGTNMDLYSDKKKLNIEKINKGGRFDYPLGLFLPSLFYVSL